MSQPKDQDFYLDWICSVHEEGCLKRNKQLSESARQTLRYLWADVADVAANSSVVFRAKRAAAFSMILESGALMAKAAELTGSQAVEPEHVRSGTRAHYELNNRTFPISGPPTEVADGIPCYPKPCWDTMGSIITRSEEHGAKQT